AVAGFTRWRRRRRWSRRRAAVCGRARARGAASGTERGAPQPPRSGLRAAFRGRKRARRAAAVLRGRAPARALRGGRARQRVTREVGERDVRERERVRLSIQDRLLPEVSLHARYERARRYGFEALELSEQPFEDAEIALREHIPISAICGGYRGWLIDPDPEKIREARKDLAHLVSLAGELGTGCVVVPIWGRTRNLPNIGTGRARDADELIFVEGMRGLASRAERAGAKLYVEPIN